jgi:hypothetical protein
MGKPLPSLLLISSPDDFLLELERDDVTTAWRGAHPDGEMLTFDEAPPAGRLVEELAAPSLFASERLLVVVGANPYTKAGRTDEADALGRALTSLPLGDVTLILTAVTKEAPEGPVVDAIRDRGEVRFLALPEPPKPWEDVRTSKEQRPVLTALVARVAPSLAGQREVVDALIEAYGFRPRALAQAAERVVLSGEPSAAAVREQAGAGECTLRDLEEALIGRTARRFVRLASIIASGGALSDWRGEAVSPDRAAMVLASTFGRLLRQALAVRAHAVRAGLRSELQPEKCAGGGWYTRTFKPRLYPLLSADIEATTGSPAEGRTAWQLHRAFRLAAAYSEEELVEALADLAGSRAERDRGPAALAAVSALVLGFIAPRAA